MLEIGTTQPQYIEKSVTDLPNQDLDNLLNLRADTIMEIQEKDSESQPDDQPEPKVETQTVEGTISSNYGMLYYKRSVLWES